MNLPELVTEIKKGNAAAEEIFIKQLSRRYILLCRRYVKDHGDAEERMHDGFLKFLSTIHSFKYQGEPALHGWIGRIMVNECIGYLRKKSSFSIVPEDEAQEISIPEEILDRLSAAEIYRIILDLPMGYRTVFNLFEIEGWTHKEIAVALGISENTSKSQLSRAKTLLQKILISNGIYYGKQSGQR
ncbi:MAG TPA: RNA polymerase sigma factor [Ferruginibacter sp.]|nr:RNA polymerase sigma factor [Ferruginibacter sp.]